MQAYVLQINGEVVAVTSTLSGALGMAATYYDEKNIEHVTATCWRGERAKITQLPYTQIGLVSVP